MSDDELDEDDEIQPNDRRIADDQQGLGEVGP